MALLGTLSGFGITEIFQLIGQQMKTGTLVLNGPRREVVVLFEEGVVRGLGSDAWSGDPRLKRLIEGNFLGDSTERQILDQAERQGIEWHELLPAQGKLSQSLLAKVNDLIVRESMLDVFQWKEGGYRFDDTLPAGRLILDCELPAEGLILDTLRVIDEWPLIKPKLPAGDYCPVKLMPLTEELVQRHRLGALETRIYDLINDTATIDAIVRQSLEIRFDALSAFVRLMDCGLIEVFPAGTLQRQLRSEFRQGLGSAAKSGAYALAGLLIVIGLLAVGRPRMSAKDWIDPMLSQQLDQPRQIASELSQRGIELSDLTTDTRVR